MSSSPVSTRKTFPALFSAGRVRWCLSCLWLLSVLAASAQGLFYTDSNSKDLPRIGRRSGMVAGPRAAPRWADWRRRSADLLTDDHVDEPSASDDSQADDSNYSLYNLLYRVAKRARVLGRQERAEMQAAARVREEAAGPWERRGVESSEPMSHLLGYFWRASAANSRSRERTDGDGLNYDDEQKLEIR